MRSRSVVGLGLGALAMLGLGGSAAPPLPRGFISAYHWQSDDPLFGGFSGIATDRAGLAFVALSDRGAFATGHLLRDGLGRIIGIRAAEMFVLHGPDGRPLGQYDSDAEGLALLADGSAYVSFERDARVARYDTLSGPGTVLPRANAFRKMSRNSSLESLAVNAEKAIFVLPERSGTMTAPFPVYRFQSGVWDQPFSLPRRGPFLAVDAKFGPDGRFYLLERAFHGFRGFASRVRRFTIGPDTVSDETTLLQTSPGQHDNLEGLSVWRDVTGSLRLTMISDDNRFFLQRTEIVEYRVPD